MSTKRWVVIALGAVAVAGLSGCGAVDKTRVCGPSNSWAQPVFRCVPVSVAAPEPAPEPAPPPAEPEAEPEKVVRKANKIEILDKIQFATDSDEILPESFPILDGVAKVMADNPDIKKVQIEGHTDPRGGKAYNKTLSQKRAESVKRYLVDKGVDGGRLTAKGYGLERPIADNSTEDGMAQNRRVEFTILEQEQPEEEPETTPEK